MQKLLAWRGSRDSCPYQAPFLAQIYKSALKTFVHDDGKSMAKANNYLLICKNHFMQKYMAFSRPHTPVIMTLLMGAETGKQKYKKVSATSNFSEQTTLTILKLRHIEICQANIKKCSS